MDGVEGSEVKGKAIRPQFTPLGPASAARNPLRRASAGDGRAERRDVPAPGGQALSRGCIGEASGAQLKPL